MRTIFILFWFVSLSAYSQTSFKWDLIVDRIPINHHGERSHQIENVIIVVDKGFFGLLTKSDTLALNEEPYKGPVKPYVDFAVYTNMDGQKYYVVRKKSKRGFVISIAPIRPFIDKPLWGITLMSI